MADEHERRLAAIVCADVVGYSRLMGIDESGTLAALNLHRGQLIEPLIADHGGRIVKTMGDGLLLEYPSIINAVKCAIAIQHGMHTRNKDLPKNQQMNFRIGINSGDIIIEKGDVFGDGVNLAARLQEHSESGGIAISARAYEDVQGRISDKFFDCGQQQFKNIPKPVTVWQWSIDQRQPVRLQSGSNKGGKNNKGQVPTVLLRPFKIGGESELASDIADELHAELFSALSQQSGIQVAVDGNRESVSFYELRARVRVYGENCRLNLAMLKCESGERFWSEQIEGSASDLFDFVADSVAKISAAMRVQIAAYDGADVANVPDVELTVEQMLSKAAFHFWRLTPDNTLIARATIANALQAAPDHPMALAMFAHSYINVVPLVPMERHSPETLDEIMNAVNRAIELGSKVEFAFRTRGTVRLWLLHDHEGARSDGERALQVNPNSHLPHLTTAVSEIMEGKSAQGIARLLNIVDLVPDEPQMPYFLSLIALGYMLIGEDEKAIEYAREAHERMPFASWHNLIYAAAAAANDGLCSSSEIRDMVKQITLPTSHFRDLPFSREEDVAQLENRLQTVGM